MSHEQKISNLRLQLKQAKSMADQRVLAYRIRLLEWAVVKKTGQPQFAPAFEDEVKQALF
jgi:hypothetical protein